jgi:hypothetical protein
VGEARPAGLEGDLYGISEPLILPFEIRCFDIVDDAGTKVVRTSRNDRAKIQSFEFQLNFSRATYPQASGWIDEWLSRS